MQANGAAHGVGTIPRRRRLNVVLTIVAVVVIAAMVALMVWAAPLARSEGGAQDANPNKVGASSAVIHDDPWNLPTNAGSAPIHDDAGNVNR
jgi:hypothetical protein